MGGKLETGGVCSGATSSGQRPSSSQSSSSTSLSRAGSGSAGTAMASIGYVDSGVDSAKGTDPKTGFVPSGGEVIKPTTRAPTRKPVSFPRAAR